MCTTPHRFDRSYSCVAKCLLTTRGLSITTWNGALLLRVRGMSLCSVTEIKMTAYTT